LAARQLSRIEGELIRAFAGAQHAVAKTQIDQLFTGLSNALRAISAMATFSSAVPSSGASAAPGCVKGI
jgi:hypothetical protein